MSTTKRDREYYRELGRKGGQATARKYGSGWMSQIGKRGWLATTTKYFRNELHHKTWLIECGLHNYWRGTQLRMKYDRFGNPIWPDRLPPHPAHRDYMEF
jgi:general stress protein YciG